MDSAETPQQDRAAVLWRLIADDDETWTELALYRDQSDAEADLALCEARYPGRPEWMAFRVEAVDITGRKPPETLDDALIAYADLSDIHANWMRP